MVNLLRKLTALAAGCLMAGAALASNLEAFAPLANTAQITSATTTANVQIPLPSPLLSYDYQVRVCNANTATVFVNFGATNAVTAVLATSNPVLAATCQIFTLPFAPQLSPGTAYMAVISVGAGAAATFVTAGIGQ